MSLADISKFITEHGIWAGATISLGITCWWLLRQLVAAQAARVADAKEAMPILSQTKIALETHTKVIDALTNELRVRR